MTGRSYKYKYYCRNCRTHYKKEDCPLYESNVQKYPICPSCPQKYKVRVTAHNKKWKEYVQRTRISMIPIFSKKDGLQR